MIFVYAFYLGVFDIAYFSRFGVKDLFFLLIEIQDFIGETDFDTLLIMVVMHYFGV